MSMNILVSTRVEPKSYYEQTNPILLSGEMAFDEEGLSILNGQIQTGVKIGDGTRTWQELEYVPNLTEEIMNKWLTIALSSTDSKLVMLPDFTFAYTEFDVSKNPGLVEPLLEKLLSSEVYLTLEKRDGEESLVANANGNDLFISAGNSLGINYSTIDSELNDIPIESITFINNQEYVEKYEQKFTFVDKVARITINDHYYKFNEKITNVETKVDNIDFDSLLKHFGVKEDNPVDGIVKGPTQKEYVSGKHFLRADNTWAVIEMFADSIKMSPNNNKTIADAIAEASQTGGTALSIGTIEEDSNQNNYVTTVQNSNDTKLRYSTGVKIQNNVLLGAAWNDYAEARITEDIPAGRVVVENGDDTLSLANDRLMLGGNIVSDTYGMLIGENESAKTPIALCGRVLAYPYEDRNNFYPGAPVCTGPKGTVSLMSKEEVLHFPECIIGYVSAVPNYEEWNGKKVNGRIWIKII